MGEGVRGLPGVSAGASAGLGQTEGGRPAAGDKSQTHPVAGSGESLARFFPLRMHAYTRRAGAGECLKAEQ